MICFRSTFSSKLKWFQVGIGTMPGKSVLCLGCRNHRSMARRRCALCGEKWVLPDCEPEQCFIWTFLACRWCVLRYLHPVHFQVANWTKDIPECVWELVLRFLQGDSRRPARLRRGISMHGNHNQIRWSLDGRFAVVEHFVSYTVFVIYCTPLLWLQLCVSNMFDICVAL